jgi:hypothetical protein
VGHPIPEAATTGPVIASPSQPRRSGGKATRDPSLAVSVDTEDDNDEGTYMETYLNPDMFRTQVRIF